MNATPDNTLADPEQRIADLERQLAEREAERDECKAQRDEALRREIAPRYCRSSTRRPATSPPYSRR